MAGNGQTLFDRRCRVTIFNPSDQPNDFGYKTVDVIEIDGGVTEDRTRTGLRVQFKIAKNLKKEPNTSEVTITNLSPDRRAKLQKKGVRLMLEAGYRDTGVSKYFSGDVRTVDHIRSDADWETKFGLGDGERSFHYSRVNESFAPGTTVSDAIKKVARSTGLAVGNVDKQAGNISAVLEQGWAAAGNASKALDQLVKMVGMTWSVQDGELQLLAPDAVLDLPIPEISVDSGLVESPEMGSPKTKGKPQLVRFKSLLIPTKPGAKVKLKSERYDGYVKVQACEFEGDTHGGPWYTIISGVIT